MAKQTYSVGQVLTSTQMDNLQANDYNQTVSAKVASYVLVAADKGTRITMSNAGATTITVNTALFAAGDTLFITNIGAGACTITAGTATVSTASSLVLAQYDSGRLYFTSTGVAIWEKYQGAAASAGALTQITQTILSSAQTYIDFNSIPGTYRSLKLIVQVPKTSYAATFDLLGLRFQANSDTGANYYNNSLQQQATTISGSAAYGATTGYVGDIPGTTPGAGNSGTAEILFNNYIGTTCYKTAFSTASVTVGTSAGNLYTSLFFSQWHNTAAITAIRLLATGDFQSGTVATLYGVS